MKYGSLLMSMVSKASCRSRSRRSRLLSDEEATPPLPVFPPALCWKSMMADASPHTAAAGVTEEENMTENHMIFNEFNG